MTALLRPDAADPPRVAFAIGRPVGAAVVRNRTRRRLRAAISELAPVSGDYLVSVTPAAADVSFDELRTHLAAALTAVGALP